VWAVRKDHHRWFISHPYLVVKRFFEEATLSLRVTKRGNALGGSRLEDEGVHDLQFHPARFDGLRENEVGLFVDAWINILESLWLESSVS